MINSTHPDYDERVPDWCVSRHTYAGQRVVKEQTIDYLSATSGMLEDGYPHPESPGLAAYTAYIKRAVFPEFFAQAVQRAVGIMHQKPPAAIKLPAKMEFLRDNATPQGEPLEMLLRKINKEQLTTGRLGLLGDMPEGESAIDSMFISIYQAETVRNWRDGSAQQGDKASLQLVVLDESGHEMDPTTLEWEESTRYRALAINEAGDYVQEVLQEGDNFDPELFDSPNVREENAKEIPFVFINAADLVSTPGKPPMLGLSELCLTIYRQEADNKRALHNQSNSTVVTVGDVENGGTGDDNTPLRIGIGARIKLPLEGEAYYINVDGVGLPEQRIALENDRKQAGEMGMQLHDGSETGAESGRALNVRIAGKTFTLFDIALAGAGGLQQMLRKIAVWMGADPLQVIVTPNLDFANEIISGETLEKYMVAKSLGLPWSKKSIHDMLVRNDMTSLSFDDENAAIDEEGIDIPEGPGIGGGDE